MTSSPLMISNNLDVCRGRCLLMLGISQIIMMSAHESLICRKPYCLIYKQPD